MSIDIIKIFQYLIPVIALFISIASLYIATKNAKRQIRVSKLEELIENISFLSGYYPGLFWLLNDLKEKKRNFKDIEEETRKFFDNVGKDNLQTKVFRARVLANSYLPNGELKARIMSMSVFLNTVYQTLQQNDYFYFNNAFPEGIPKIKDVMNVVETIEKGLIKEMNLGYRDINTTFLNKFYRTTFKKELKLK